MSIGCIFVLFNKQKNIMLVPIKKEYLENNSSEYVSLYIYENVSKEELQQEAERLTYRAPYCGCAHDCCGCFSSPDAEVKSNNTIEVREYFNY